MRIGERQPALGQSLHGGRFDIGMTTERLDPVIQVVDRDHDNVGPIFLFARLRSGTPRQESQSSQENQCESSHGIRLDDVG